MRRVPVWMLGLLFMTGSAQALSPVTPSAPAATDGPAMLEHLIADPLLLDPDPMSRPLPVDRRRASALDESVLRTVRAYLDLPDARIYGARRNGNYLMLWVTGTMVAAEARTLVYSPRANRIVGTFRPRAGFS